MTRSARFRGPLTPRWVRGLMLGGLFAVITTGSIGCGLVYVARNMSPLHVTGWSTIYPITPYASQTLEEDLDKEKADRVPILDPLPSEYTSSPCLDPPSDDQVWNKVPKFRHGWPMLYEVQRNNVRILTEKIGEAVDPVKIYPLAGPCQLVHCHFKCTVYFDELYWSDYPVPFNHVDHRVEVVYIDKDHLRRAGGPPVATSP